MRDSWVTKIACCVIACDRSPVSRWIAIGGSSPIRLAELLFRYKARNHPEHLTAAEQARWAAFCATRLNDPGAGAPNTLAAFEQAARALLATVSPAEQAMLQAWLEHARELKTRYRL